MKQLHTATFLKILYLLIVSNAFLCQVPRALVNLVEPLHIIPLREMHLDSSLKCPTWLVK